MAGQSAARLLAGRALLGKGHQAELGGFGAKVDYDLFDLDYRFCRKLTGLSTPVKLAPSARAAKSKPL
jgi:hypothetical protein